MKINTHIKGMDTAGLQPQDAPETKNDELKTEVDGALAELEEFKGENAEWLSEENMMEMERLEVTLKAQSAALGAYGEGGPGYQGPGGVDPTLWELPQNLAPEWNGIPEDHKGVFQADADRLAADPEWYGDYMGTMQMPNSGDPNTPTNVGFQMTDDMIAIYGESMGRDIAVTVEYADGSRATWILKDGSVRPEPLIISALGLDGVLIDFHRVFRQEGELYIHGSEGNDEIYGAQSGTGIVGYAGDDMIYGGAGKDTIYGDEYYQMSGQFDPSYGGHDTIYGGVDKDILYGGAGIDTQFASDNGESVNEFENVENDLTTEPPDPTDWLSSDTWELVEDESEDGVLLYRNENPEGLGGNIDIFLDQLEGDCMVFGEMGSDGSLILNIVGDEGTFKVKFEDFFNEKFGAKDPADRVVRLTIHGTEGNDIINMDKVEVTSQVINILDSSGDDIILGAHNQLLSDGVDLDKLTQSQKNGAAVLQDAVNGGIFAADEEHQYNKDGDLKKWCGYEAKLVDGQIVITEDSDPATKTEGILCLKAPDGYEHGYITSDSNGDIYVILVKPQSTGDAKTIVIKIDGSLGLGYNEIVVKNVLTTTAGEGNAESTSLGAPFTLTAISLDEYDYVIDGGEGNDLIFAQKGTKVNDESNEIVWEDSAPMAPPPAPPGSEKKPEAPKEDQKKDEETPPDSEGEPGA